MKFNHYVIILVQICVLVCANPVWAKASQQPAIQTVLDQAYFKFKSQNPGKNADYIPALAEVDSNFLV